MDPYLEAHWLDVHPRLIVEAATVIQQQLGDDLVARIEERLLVEDAVGPIRRLEADVRIVEFGPQGTASGPRGVAAVRQRFIEIIDVATAGRVITVIEFVSPSNKLPGDGLEQYKQKQAECRDARVNLVEIDLTRRGRRVLMVQGWVQARLHESDYQASVWWAAWGSQCALYEMSLRERLPAIQFRCGPVIRTPCWIFRRSSIRPTPQRAMAARSIIPNRASRNSKTTKPHGRMNY